MWTAKALIRLGWSESLLGTHSFCWFCHEVVHFVNKGFMTYRTSAKSRLFSANRIFMFRCSIFVCFLGPGFFSSQGEFIAQQESVTYTLSSTLSNLNFYRVSKKNLDLFLKMLTFLQFLEKLSHSLPLDTLNGDMYLSLSFVIYAELLPLILNMTLLSFFEIFNICLIITWVRSSEAAMLL